MDLTGSTAPLTNQQNFDNYLAGPKTLTISEVKLVSGDQPVELHLVEYPGQPYKPSRSMRRVLVSAWGADGAKYAGRRITLYGDPTVRYGPAVVGGIKISHLSDIDGPVKINLTVTRGKRALFTVQPLPDAPTAPPVEQASPEIIAEWVSEFTAATDITALQQLWSQAGKAGVASNPLVIAAKDQRKGELT